MRIWTIKLDEPLPIPQDGGRIMRCGIISQMLADRGHEVTWWSSGYSHQLKKRFYDEYTEVKLSENYTLKLLHAKTVYNKNISIKRLFYLKQLAREFKKLASQCERPDIIYCSYPSIDFAYAAVRLGKRWNIPTIVDIRDLWPDIFVQPFPRLLHPLMRLCFCVETAHAKYAIKNADKLIAVVPAFIKWAKKKGRILKDGDEVLYHGYRAQRHTDEEIKEADFYWKSLNVTDEQFVVCYIGTVNPSIRLEMLIEAAKKMRGTNVKFVICGGGNHLTKLKKMASGLDNVVFTGYIDDCKIQRLMHVAKIGTITTKPKMDFVDAVPNKALEYMAGELIVLSTLEGHLRNILDKTQSGLFISDVDSIVRAITKFLDDDGLTAQMKHNARETYENNYQADKIYGSLCDEIEDLVTGSMRQK